MSAPFMIRPDTNQVCTEAGMRLLSAEPVAATVPGAVNLRCSWRSGAEGRSHCCIAFPFLPDAAILR